MFLSLLAIAVPAHANGAIGSLCDRKLMGRQLQRASFRRSDATLIGKAVLSTHRAHGRLLPAVRAVPRKPVRGGMSASLSPPSRQGFDDRHRCERDLLCGATPDDIKARLSGVIQSRGLSFAKLPRIYVPSRAFRLYPFEEVIVYKTSSPYLRYVVKVNGKRPKRAMRIFNEDDGEYLATLNVPDSEALQEDDDFMAVIRVGRRIRPPPKPAFEIFGQLTLHFALIKAVPLKLLVEKASEAGVNVLQPVIVESAPSMLRRKTKRRSIVMQGLRRKLELSAERSERMTIASLETPVTLPTVLREWNHTKGFPRLFVCRERFVAKPLLTAVREALRRGESNIGLLVGPEKDYDDFEMDELEAVPFVEFVSLGATVMASETAGLVALGIARAAIEEYKWARKQEKGAEAQPFRGLPSALRENFGELPI